MGFTIDNREHLSLLLDNQTLLTRLQHMMADSLKESRLFVYGIEPEIDEKLSSQYRTLSSGREPLYMGIISKDNILIVSDTRVVGKCSCVLLDSDRVYYNDVKIDMHVSDVKTVGIWVQIPCQDIFLSINRQYLISVKAEEDRAALVELLRGLLEVLQLKVELYSPSANRYKYLHSLCRVYARGKYIERDEQVIFESYQMLLGEIKGREMTRELFELQRILEYEIGCHYFHGAGVDVDKQEAVKWLGKAARKGHAGAQNMLGYCYYYGIGIKKDRRRAFQYYKQAAERGDFLSQYNLALCCMEGVDTGVPNEDEAFKWFGEAARQGYPPAQSDLATCYHYGRGSFVDMNNARDWYEEAACRGNSLAQYNLANMYFLGNGVVKDLNKAREWYAKAVQGGFDRAEAMLEVISK